MRSSYGFASARTARMDPGRSPGNGADLRLLNTAPVDMAMAQALTPTEAVLALVFEDQ